MKASSFGSGSNPAWVDLSLAGSMLPLPLAKRQSQAEPHHPGYLGHGSSQISPCSPLERSWVKTRGAPGCRAQPELWHCSRLRRCLSKRSLEPGGSGISHVSCSTSAPWPGSMCPAVAVSGGDIWRCRIGAGSVGGVGGTGVLGGAERRGVGVLGAGWWWCRVLGCWAGGSGVSGVLGACGAGCCCWWYWVLWCCVLGC